MKANDTGNGFLCNLSTVYSKKPPELSTLPYKKLWLQNPCYPHVAVTHSIPHIFFFLVFLFMSIWESLLILAAIGK